ncbi:MAG: lipid kinase YegS [Myxococcota bacterium]
MASRIILHGKQAANEELRAAVAAVRKSGAELDVRVTWEAGDAGRLAAEAARAGFERVIAGGGDGTVNEVLAGLRSVDFGGALGVLPLGTANDFARSAGIPPELEPALQLAASGSPTRVDVGCSGTRVFLNVATGGFGTQITVETDPRLKKAMGGAAYLLTGVTRFSSIEPVQCQLRMPDETWEGHVLVFAVGNGRQAGGGQVLCPEATVDDGAFDVTVLEAPAKDGITEMVGKLMTRGPESLETFTRRWRTPWVEVDAPEGMHINLDGEPTHATHHRFDLDPGALRLVLPEDSPLLAGGAPASG